MFSLTAEYALSAMMTLSRLGNTPVSSRQLAHEANVPRCYLSKIMNGLARARLVVSHRGPHGGFALSRSPSDITLLHVIGIFDRLHRSPVARRGNQRNRLTVPSLDRAIETLEDDLSRMTLADVLATQPNSMDA